MRIRTWEKRKGDTGVFPTRTGWIMGSFLSFMKRSLEGTVMTLYIPHLTPRQGNGREIQGQVEKAERRHRSPWDEPPPAKKKKKKWCKGERTQETIREGLPMNLRWPRPKCTRRLGWEPYIISLPHCAGEMLRLHSEQKQHWERSLDGFLPRAGVQASSSLHTQASAVLCTVVKYPTRTWGNMVRATVQCPATESQMRGWMGTLFSGHNF